MRTVRKAATAECCACHYIFPKPEMHQASRHVGGGYQQGRRTNCYNKNGHLIGYSQSQGYSRPGRAVAIWYCQDCYPAYVRARRRSTVGCVAVLFIAIAALVGFVSHSKSDSVSKPPSTELPPSEATIDPKVSFQVPEAAPVDLGDSDSLREPVYSLEGTAPQLPAIKQDAPVLERTTPESSKALRAAISKALATGDSHRWRDSGSAGYAVPSAVEPQSGCRSLYYTIDTERPAWKSPIQSICPDAL